MKRAVYVKLSESDDELRSFIAMFEGSESSEAVHEAEARSVIEEQLGSVLEVTVLDEQSSRAVALILESHE